MSQTCRLDPCAVTAFYFERFGQRMYATASGLLSKQDRSLSPDVTHDAFLTFHCAVDANQLHCLRNCRYADLVQKLGPCRRYLVTVLRRRCREVESERQRAREVPFEMADYTCQCNHRGGPQPVGQQSKLCRAVYDSLDRLSLTNREILVLFEIAGLGCAEIGQQLEMSQTAVRTRLSRARKRLRCELEGVIYDM